MNNENVDMYRDVQCGEFNKLNRALTVLEVKTRKILTFSILQSEVIVICVFDEILCEIW